nr:MAG TPA: hypothetical protein [Caudoviricetes sp.]DAT51001.1 MAG TPA: hypothetical protein [Caudoviricetes sp.]
MLARCSCRGSSAYSEGRTRRPPGVGPDLVSPESFPHPRHR